MSLYQSWDVARISDENERLHRKNYKLGLEVTKLRNVIKNTCGMAEPYKTPGGDIKCGNCTLNLGAWEEVTEWSYCPFCGAHIDWEGEEC